MDSSVLRYDFAPITGSETTEEGYLRVWCRAARTGTQLYRRADGSQVREYRPPEEVSKPESLATFGMTPVTWGHPPVLLDAANTKQFQIGYSGSQVRFNDGFVEVALVVTDAEQIARIQRKDAAEVSAGYRVDFDPTPGMTPEGESYDGIQRNIRVNHLAIVPRGRAGPEVRLLMDRMDAADAVACDLDPTPTSHSTPLASPAMASINMDGLEIDLPEAQAAAVQAHLRDLGRQLADAKAANAELTARVDALQTDLETLTDEKEAAEGRADALEERLDALEDGDSPEGARIDTAELDQLVAQRLATLQHLAPAFADDFHMDGIGDDELYSHAFESLTGSAPADDAEPTYVRGVVDGILAARADSDDEDDDAPEGEDPEDDDEPDRSDSAASLRTSLRGAGRSPSSPADAYRARHADAWKRPLTATKS